MKLCIVSGSHRNDSQSIRVAEVLAAKVEQGALFDEVEVIDLANNPLPLWDESIWAGDPEWKPLLAPVSAQLSAADAFIIISPEWHGMVPAGLKNFFLMWNRGELAHKPALLVAVSAGMGGAYPVAELRMSSYKNNRICYIPEQLILRNIETLYQNDGSLIAEIDERADYCLRVLQQYSVALQSVRQSGVVDMKRFPNGL